MKEKYERALIYKVLIDKEDVIATSGDATSGDFGSTESNHVSGGWVT